MAIPTAGCDRSYVVVKRYVNTVLDVIVLCCLLSMTVGGDAATARRKGSAAVPLS